MKKSVSVKLTLWMVLQMRVYGNIHKKRQRIKQGSGERMRKKGEKGGLLQTNEEER